MTIARPFDSFEHWIACGWLTQLDKAFAAFLKTQDDTANEIVLWAGALVSQQLGRGEVYLDLAKLCSQPELTLAIASPDPQQTHSIAMKQTASSEVLEFELSSYKLNDWITALNNSRLVSSGPGDTPLVLQENRLYLRRYWQYQQTVWAEIDQRLQPDEHLLPAEMLPALQALFNDAVEQPDWQKIACVLALRARFTIITGGPGTGKTTTLTKLLSLIIQLNEASPLHRKLNIFLAAPTGKAAARVSESIAKALDKLQVPESIKQQIPKKACTLHRLLGSRPDSRQFQHHRANPLLADIVIVDEASMIDLEMMAGLLAALPAHAQLILLGDKDQLASVEAGSVMGDLCQGAEQAAYDHPTRSWINRYTDTTLPIPAQNGSPINQQTVMLQYSHRFGAFSGIGQLAKAVNNSDTHLAQDIFIGKQYSDLDRIILSATHDVQLKQLIVADDANARPGYGHYLKLMQQRPTGSLEGHQNWAMSVLKAFDDFQLLCALRQGDWGVEGLNQRIEQWLFPGQKSGHWYAGRPVMITRNDYNLGLMNGDIGITLLDVNHKLRVVFPNNDPQDAQPLRWLSPLRLPEVETAFAMTVHKSQGSEFRHVALILPEIRSPVITKELIYTGITRAKDHFSLLESKAGIFAQAIQASCKTP